MKEDPFLSHLKLVSTNIEAEILFIAKDPISSYSLNLCLDWSVGSMAKVAVFQSETEKREFI